jgi:hypothetical protein
MVSINYKCLYVDVVWVRAHWYWMTMQQMRRLFRKYRPSSRQNGGPISKHINCLGTKQCGYELRRALISRTTVVARASSDLLLCYGLGNGRNGQRTFSKHHPCFVWRNWWAHRKLQFSRFPNCDSNPRYLEYKSGRSCSVFYEDRSARGHSSFWEAKTAALYGWNTKE